MHLAPIVAHCKPRKAIEGAVGETVVAEHTGAGIAEAEGRRTLQALLEDRLNTRKRMVAGYTGMALEFGFGRVLVVGSEIVVAEEGELRGMVLVLERFAARWPM